MALIAFFVMAFFLQGTMSELICEDLPINFCSFSVASSGKRCLLETYMPKDGSVQYQCITSEVVVEKIPEYIETDDCMDACGVDRNFVGISSDSLLDPHFTAKLCSSACYHNCPNIVDLYFNLALGEGVYLPDLCEARQTNPRRAMTAVRSSGAALSSTAPGSADAAPGPISSAALGPESSKLFAPALAPTSV